MKKTFIYNDPINDDFAGTNIKPKPLGSSYHYIHNNFLWCCLETFLFRVIAQPLTYLFNKIVFLQSFKNKSALKAINKNDGIYIYINHTNKLLDAFCPHMICYKKRTHIVVGPDTMSISGLKNIVQMLGAIPIGNTLNHKIKMRDCIHKRTKQGRVIAIYPEAHIWPFYTDIRPFSEASFQFPAKDGFPTFAITNCYKKRRFGKFPRVVTYIDGPFYPQKNLSERQNRKYLHDKCQQAMKKRALENSDYEYVKYIFNEKDKNANII